MPQPYAPTPKPTGVLSLLKVAGWAAAELQRISDTLHWTDGAIDPRDFGLSGRGETNEQPQFQAMLDKLPDGAGIDWPTPDFKVGLYAPVELRNKGRVSIGSRLWHWDDYASEWGDASATGGLQLIWGGSADETVLAVTNCGQCRIGGFSIHGMNAGVLLDIDQTRDRKRICTSNEFTRIRLVGGVGNRNFIGVRISATSTDNVEYMRFDRVKVTGNGDIDPTQELFGASMQQGSDLLEWTGTFGDEKTLTGKRVRVPGAGDGQRFNGRLLDARIVARIDDHHVRLDTIAANTTSNRRWLLDEALGIGWQVHSQNSMGHVLDTCHASACAIGIHLVSGSLHTENYHADQNDENWRIENGVSACVTERNTNSENSRIHATIGCIPPFTSYAPTLRLNRVCPGTGYFKPLPGVYGIKIEDGTISKVPGDGSTVWDFTEAAGARIRSEHVGYDFAYDDASFGLSHLPNNCTFESDDYQPGAKLFGGRRVFGNRESTLRPGESIISVNGDVARVRVRAADGRLGTVVLPVTWDS